MVPTSQAEELKLQGNTAFRNGDVQTAIRCYTSALATLPTFGNRSEENKTADPGAMGNGCHSSYYRRMAATLLSNRAMCHLKTVETSQQTKEDLRQHRPQQEQSLASCVDDCTLALDHLDNANESDMNNLRGKILYRRSKARQLLSSLFDGDDGDEDVKEKQLNASASDLLQLLSFDGNNKQAATLLRELRVCHGKLGGGMGRSRISRALDSLRTAVAGRPGGNGGHDEHTTAAATEGGNREQDKPFDPLHCLRVLQGSLAEDVASSAEDIGRRGGAALLLTIARRRNQVSSVASLTAAGIMTEQQSTVQQLQQQKCRIAALHTLSACCSNDQFLSRYAGRDAALPSALAGIVQEETLHSALPSSEELSAEVVVAAMALLVRLIVHHGHREVARFFAAEILPDGTCSESTPDAHHDVPGVDGSSVCRVLTGAFLWGGSSKCNNYGNDSDARPPRAALDLLSAWTASDLDALDAASVACDAPSSNSSHNNNGKRASCHILTPADMRRMKPRQVAAHRKREAEFRRASTERAMKHIAAFCSRDVGGLDSMLRCAVGTSDKRLRREVGLQIGRMASAYDWDGNEDGVKKLAAEALGCTDWKVGKEETEGGIRVSENCGGLSSLTIEELDDEEKEVDDNDREGGKLLVDMMKRGQLTASLLLGKPEVGTWALKHGWSNGNGLTELKQLISSDELHAMSIASELVSAASSVESSRPLLLPLVEEGTLEDLLVHPDADIRSGAASCIAKIGLASKALSADEGEVMGLLDVAIELLFDEAETLSGASQSATKHVMPPLTKHSTSMERGIEVLAYLVSKTFVKEKIASGYKPRGSPASRKTALQRLVELSCGPKSEDAQAGYGLAGIFNLLSVSTETLRREAFVGKEITKEQYDQLQALGKTEEEKELEAEKNELEGRDGPKEVSERVRKLAGANVPKAMVKLLGSRSNATQEKLLEGMGRMASEPPVRGIMIQQGCLTACLHLDKGEKPNETEKNILRRARICVAKMLVTCNPGTLTVTQRSDSVGILLQLVKDSDALDLMHFEALMSLTNLASFDNETKNRIVAQDGLQILGYAMFSDHELVRLRATEAMCNLVPHSQFMHYLTKEENLRVWIAFSLDYEENFECARAAVGCLAMAVPDPDVAMALVKSSNFDELIRTLMECGQLELMHRVLALELGLIGHGGICREAVVATGARQFCDAYILRYQDDKKTTRDFNFGPSERRSLVETLNLAKDVVKLLS